MGNDFIQSGCQDFTVSPCQNRGLAASQLQSLCVGSFAGAGIGNSLFYQRPTDFSIHIGQLNSVDLPSFTWQITWDMLGTLVNVNAIATISAIYISGNGTNANGTIARHPIISVIPGPTFNMGAAIQTILVNGSAGTTLNDPTAGTFPGQTLLVWWIGKTPATIPAGGFQLQSGGIIAGIGCVGI